MIEQMRKHTENFNNEGDQDKKLRKASTLRFRNQEIKRLEELLKWRMVKEYCDSIQRPTEIWAFEGESNQTYFDNLQQLDTQINKLKLFLEAEKWALAEINAEKRFKVIKSEIDTDIEKSKLSIRNWVSWIPGLSRKHNTAEEPENEIDENFEELITQYSSLMKREIDLKNPKKISFHMNIALSLFEVIMFNRATPDSPLQVFFNFRLHDIYLQQINNLEGKSEYLFRVENINVVNSTKSLDRFEFVFRKKPKVANTTEDESDEFLSRINSEVEEELDPVENDGLPQIESFTNIINWSTSPPLILFEYSHDPSLKNIESNPPTNNISIKLSINAFELYYDREMLTKLLSNVLSLK
jgi:uncharacterized protein YukE